MGNHKPFKIRGLEPNENQRLSRIGLTFLIVYINSKVTNNMDELLQMKNFYYLTTFYNRAKNIQKYKAKAIKIVLSYAMVYTDKQRLKNKMGKSLQQIHDLATDAKSLFKSMNQLK